MQPAAIIFDCDGTLADTMPAHYEAWRDTLVRYGLTLTEDRFYALGGCPSLRVAEMLIAESGADWDAAEIAENKEAEFRLRIDSILAIEPVTKVALENRGRLPIAVATGATREICLLVLRQIGLAEIFDAIVCAEDVAYHKPAPDIFLEAARRLGVAASACRVYEDADPGVEGARKAQMDVVDVRTFYRPRRVT